MTRELPNPITKEFLEAEAESVKFTHITGTLTHCAITVEGGFIFTGESACADPLNYDPVKGEKYAHENAISKMWLPYGFLLKHQLMEKERDINRAPKTSTERHVLASIGDIHASAGTIAPDVAVTGLSYGAAIEALERGERVMRAGWNGKNMWLILIEADQYELRAWKYFNATEQLPFIAMKTADNKIVPWLASQTDMLAKDWAVA